MPHILTLVNDEYATISGNTEVKEEVLNDVPADEDVVDDGQLAWALTVVLLEHGRFRYTTLPPYNYTTTSSTGDFDLSPACCWNRVRPNSNA